MGREMQSGTSISLTGMVENAHFNELEYRPRLSCIFALYRPETSYIESLSNKSILNLHLRPGRRRSLDCDVVVPVAGVDKTPLSSGHGLALLSGFPQ